MSNIMIYTFRTFPELSRLQEGFDDVFVFSHLKDDLEALKVRLMDERPRLLIGLAATKGSSRVEPVAVNKFNRGVVVKEGPTLLPLHLPSELPFALAKKPTHTFCNWTMYQVQYFIDEEGLSTQLVFMHINVGDLEKCTNSILELVA